MRIAVITSSYPRYTGDGTAPFVKSLSDALRKRGHDVEILAPYDSALKEGPNQPAYVTRFKYVWPKRWHILGHARSLDGDTRLRPLAVILLPLFLLSGLYHLLRLIRKQDTQLIHAHWLLPNGLVAMWAAAITKTPFIVSLHGSDMYMAGKNSVFKSVARYILKRASKVSACSQELKERAEALGAVDKVHLIAWGADPERFKPLHDKSEARHQFGWKDDEFVICSLGRMVEKKGFPVLVSAFARLYQSSQNTKLRLVIGGEGPQQKLLQVQEREMGVGHLTDLPGRINWQEVPKFLAAADVFVLPSVRDSKGNLDGLPTVLLEAMSCGLPCITSDIGGVKLVIRDGENGWLMKPGDEEELIELLDSSITDRYQRVLIGEQARRDVETKFNWVNVALLFEKLATIALYENHKLRLGHSYRNEMLPGLVKLPNATCVLDIGCRDDSWLKALHAKVRVGVDLNPSPSFFNESNIVKADAAYLPFKPGAFDLITALDMIEHVENVEPLLNEMGRVSRVEGGLLITTPSESFKLFPWFLTDHVSKRWGHIWRRGFNEQQMECFLRRDYNFGLLPWAAKAYRRWYLVLKTLSLVSARWALNFMKHIIRYDLKHQSGPHGFWLVSGQKKG